MSGTRFDGVWSDYVAEVGPLSGIDPRSAHELLEAHLIEAMMQKADTITIPVEAGAKLADMLGAWLTGKSPQGPHRPRKSWRDKRWELTAAEQVLRRKAELIVSEKMSAFAAEAQALKEIAPQYHVARATLKDWVKRLAARRKSK